VRPVTVVMVGEDVERAFEMLPVEDKEPVEAFRADGTHEALGDCVRLRRVHRRPDELDPLASEDSVEVSGELAVAIPDQEANRCRAVDQSPGELTGLLGDPAAARVRRAASEVHPSALELDEEKHVQPLQEDRLDGEEVDRDHAVRLRAYPGRIV
jgi:hypothetical protein